MSLEASDYQKYLVLFVDDEEKTRKYFKRLFGDAFNILLAADGVEALTVLKENLAQVALIVTDQRMPNETGVAFLEKATKLKPEVVRILSTAFADIDAAIDSVNKGGVYRYITKPWDVADLELTLRRAMEYYLLHEERDELLQQKLVGVQQLAIADRVLSLAALSVARENNLRYLSDAMVAGMNLYTNACARAGTGAGAQAGSWKEAYQLHHAFLSKAAAALPKNLTTGQRLSSADKVSASSLLSTVGSGTITVQPATGEASLPGPAAQLQAIFTSVLSALAAAGGSLSATSAATGIECEVGAAGLVETLTPVFGDSLSTPSEAAFQLVGALMQFSHNGGTFTMLPRPSGSTVRLRLDVAASRLADAPSNAIEDLAADLIGNELFWSRDSA